MKFSTLIAVLCVTGLVGAAFAAPSVQLLGPTNLGGGLLGYDLQVTAGAAEANPNAFEIHATNVRQEWAFGGALSTPTLDNASFLGGDIANDTHMLFFNSAFVAFNGVDGPHDITAPFTSTFHGDQMSLQPGSVPGSQYSFFHFVVGDTDTSWVVSGLVAAPNIPTPGSYSFAGGAVADDDDDDVIPEPGTLGLLAVGAVLFLARRRRA